MSSHGSVGGFTLLELIVTFFVLALLAAIAVPQYQRLVRDAALQSDMDQMAAIGRGAAGSAVTDGFAVPTPAHFAEALEEVSQSSMGATPGVSAQAQPPTLSDRFALYTQEGWDALTAYPDHGGRRVMVAVTSEDAPQVAGLASLTPGDPGSCSMVMVARGQLVVEHSATVEDPMACDGLLAAEGPEGGIGGGPGGGGGGPGGPLPGVPPRVFGFNMYTTSGSFDDFVATAGGSEIASDDFSGSDGVLLPGPDADWEPVGSTGMPLVTEGRLTGLGASNQLLAVVDLPDSAWAASARVTSLPASGEFMQMLVASKADGRATHLVTVQAGGQLVFGGRIPDCGANDFANTTLPVSVSPGQALTLERTNDNVASLRLDGSVVATIDRSTLPAGVCP
jgi:type II secretory pathway pseudopilin PulG